MEYPELKLFFILTDHLLSEIIYCLLSGQLSGLTAQGHVYCLLKLLSGQFRQVLTAQVHFYTVGTAYPPTELKIGFPYMVQPPISPTRKSK